MKTAKGTHLGRGWTFGPACLLLTWSQTLLQIPVIQVFVPSGPSCLDQAPGNPSGPMVLQGNTWMHSINMQIINQNGDSYSVPQKTFPASPSVTPCAVGWRAWQDFSRPVGLGLGSCTFLTAPARRENHMTLTTHLVGLLELLSACNFLVPTYSHLHVHKIPASFVPMTSISVRSAPRTLFRATCAAR
ncbi:hypothetical protein F4780DRAFT_127147 [Xylariomycetidae sp. FL0641]|nr:hypothetical protein F4780DRAFT_127147 [Xylariomycetidae sp. FL0641]